MPKLKRFPNYVEYDNLVWTFVAETNTLEGHTEGLYWLDGQYMTFNTLYAKTHKVKEKDLPKDFIHG